MWVEKTKKIFFKNNLSAFSTTPKLIFFLQMPSFIFFCTHIGLPHQWTTFFFFFFFQEPIPRNFLPLCPPPLSSSSRQWHCFFSCLFGDEVKRVGGFWSKSESISQLSDRFGLYTTKKNPFDVYFSRNFYWSPCIVFYPSQLHDFFPSYFVPLRACLDTTCSCSFLPLFGVFLRPAVIRSLISVSKREKREKGVSWS